MTNTNQQPTQQYGKRAYHLDAQLQHGESESEFYTRKAAERSASEKHTGTTLSAAFAEMAEQRAKEQAAQLPPEPTWTSIMLPLGDPLRKKATWEKFHPGEPFPGEPAH